MSSFASSAAAGKVQAQYEAYSYPEPVTDLEAASKGGHWLGDPSLFSPLIWPEGRPKRDLRILVAGCGTNQAAHLAFTNPGCDILGIDFSRASIANQEALRNRHDLKNLRLQVMDLRRIGDLGEQFDYIVSTGVLHHLPNPEEGLRALSSVLAQHGKMFLMLYATAGRVGLYLLQDAFRRLKLEQNPTDIEFARRIYGLLPDNHYVRLYADTTREMHLDASFVDSFLHNQDRSYTIPEVMEFLQSNGLAFQGWHDEGHYAAETYFETQPDILSRVKRQSQEDQWSFVESALLVHRVHNFIACRPEQLPAARPSLDEPDWLDFIPILHPALMSKPESDSFDGRQVLFKRGATEFRLNKASALVVHAVNGRRRLRDICLCPPFTTKDKSQVEDFVSLVAKYMTLRGHMFISRSN